VSSVGFHRCHCTHMCLLSVHPIQIVVPLPIWSVFERLTKKCIPLQDQLMSGGMEPRVESLVPEGKFVDPQENKESEVEGFPEHQMVVFTLGTFLQPLQYMYVAQHVRCEQEWCGPEVDGPLEVLMASLSIGFFEAGLLYPSEWWRKETAAL